MTPAYQRQLLSGSLVLRDRAVHRMRCKTFNSRNHYRHLARVKAALDQVISALGTRLTAGVWDIKHVDNVTSFLRNTHA